MKRIFLLICFLSFGIAQAQEASQTEDRYGVSAGVIGVWVSMKKQLPKISVYILKLAIMVDL